MSLGFHELQEHLSKLVNTIFFQGIFLLKNLRVIF